MSVVAKSGQTISFCGVSAHFQNGIAEKRICDLSEQARKQLLHAKARWPSAIKINLWPYALCNANNIWNTIADKDDGSSPLERFCLTDQSPPEVKTQSHIWLSRLCTQLSPPRWQSNSQMESKSKTWHQPWTFASTCKIHEPGAETRYRVSLATIHIQYDDFFEPVRPSSGNERTFSQWQYISGLIN